MSRRSCSLGDRLCQLLHSRPAQGAPVPLCFNYLFHSKHGLTLSKLYPVCFSFTSAQSVPTAYDADLSPSCKILLLCGKICYLAFCFLNCAWMGLCVYFCVSACMLSLDVPELGLHHGPGVWPVGEAGAVRGPAGKGQLHARLGHARQEVWGQTGQSNTR